MLVLICGSVITGTGSKSYLKVLMERVWGDENLTNIDVENMDMQDTGDLDELQVFREIRNETGISPVHFGYIPKKMYLKEYEINGEQGRAVLLYDYKGQTIRYTMYMNDADSSHGRTDIDDLIDEYVIQLENNVQVKIEEYKVVNKKMHRFAAEFEYQDIFFRHGCRAWKMAAVYKAGGYVRRREDRGNGCKNRIQGKPHRIRMSGLKIGCHETSFRE